MVSPSPTLNMLASQNAQNMSLLGQNPASMSDKFTRGSARAPSKVQQLHTGTPLYPLFCVSVYEHNWLSAGYGVWGKEEWMKRFWDVLYWPKINQTWQMLQKERGIEVI